MRRICCAGLRLPILAIRTCCTMKAGISGRIGMWISPSPPANRIDSCAPPPSRPFPTRHRCGRCGDCSMVRVEPAYEPMVHALMAIIAIRAAPRFGSRCLGRDGRMRGWLGVRGCLRGVANSLSNRHFGPQAQLDPGSRPLGAVALASQYRQNGASFPGARG